jgi:hypothetical protein
MTAITSRTADNAIFDHLDSIGDKDTFFDMDAAGFQRCQDDMVESVYNKELEQRHKIENVEQFPEDDDDDDEDGDDEDGDDEDDDDEDETELYEEELERQLDNNAEQLLDLVEDCERVGYRICSGSLKRYLVAGSDATNDNS